MSSGRRLFAWATSHSRAEAPQRGRLLLFQIPHGALQQHVVGMPRAVDGDELQRRLAALNRQIGLEDLLETSSVTTKPRRARISRARGEPPKQFINRTSSRR